MGINENSGQIEIIGEYGSVFLYTHDLAHTLIHAIHDILSKKEKWNDPDYFTRMLFCRIVPPELWNTNDGFGIGTQMYADVKFFITVDLTLKKLTITNWNDLGTNCRAIHYKFEDFIDNFVNNASL